MRSGGFITAFLSCCLLTTTAFTAPLNGDQTNSPSGNENARGGVPVKPAFIAPSGRSLGDRDANGLSDSLEQLLNSKGAEDRVNVIVTFSGPGNSASAQRAVGAFSIYREFSLIRGFAATMSAAQARALANSAGVFRVEEDATAYINLEAARQDFGVEALRGAASTSNLTGSGVKVCILDTGLQADQEQFTGAAGRQVTFVDLVGDYFGNIRTIPYDDHGHGTHVAGIVGGDGTPGDGEGADSTIAPLARGVAPAVHIHAVKVLNYNGSGPDSGIIAGVQECLTAGAHVANLSLGIPGSSDGRDALSQAVDAAVDAGMAVVVAAGNAGDGPQTIGSPGAAVKAITVGAVAEHTASTIADATSLGVYAAPFSSRGPTLDGRTKPDISAPGVSILSAMSNVVAVDPDPIWGGGGEVTLGCGEGCYTVSSGTSMASPFVAGAVALMLEADGSLTTDSAMVRQILADTAQDRGTVGMDNVFGHGLIDVQAAVSRAANAGAETTSFPHHVFQQGTVPDGISVRVPVGVIDMTKPLAITVAIEGRLTRRGWSPDLDVILLDANRQPFMVNNPLYPWLSDDPTVPAPGTSSTCPAGEDCGQMGTQETIHIQPDTLQPGNPLFFVEIYPFAERPNNGKGGNYTIGLSNGYFAGPIDGPADNQLVARAGSDVTVIDDDDDGSADVTLDGRASLGMINEYLWSGTAGAESTAVATVRLPIGTHTFSLSVTNTVTGAMDTDSMTVTVTGSSSDGGEKGGGKRCNPKREVCD